jgi:hypothetical protein
MCPLFSCCHGRSTSPLSTPLYYLTRLLLALDAGEQRLVRQPRFSTRLDALWAHAGHLVQARYRVSQARAQELTEQLLTALLREACCRQALPELVSLAEAWGGRVQRGHWRTRIARQRRPARRRHGQQ